METINRSYLLKEYYGSEFFYDSVKAIFKKRTYNVKTLKGAVNVMWELGTINN